MENNIDFNVDYEINKIEQTLSNKSQLSTIDLALIYNFCDRYIKNNCGINILEIFDKCNSGPEDITRFIIMKLSQDYKIINFINKYNIYEILANTIYNMGNKKILYIDHDVINHSNKQPHQMPIPSNETQIKRIFSSLRKNYELYEQLYKDKVWLINSTNISGENIGQARIKISPYQFFHLMGFDYREKLNPNGKDKLGNSFEPFAREFSQIFSNSQEGYRMLSEFGNQKKHQINQYTLIEKLLENENRFLELLMDGRLRNTVNIEKIEMKCFSFERMGVIQTASGMVFFDKQKAIDLGYNESVKHINPDIILLNDFIRRYDNLGNIFNLDFVISPFDKIHGRQISDQQSIFLTREPNGGLSAGVLDQQTASISSSAVGYRENDFNFAISEEKDSDTTQFPEPIDFREFSEESRKIVAQSMIEAFPNLDKTNLEDLVNNKHRQK